MPWIPLHQTSHIWWQIYIYIYIYLTMHIYPWQIDPPSIEHRCLEYCYTKLGRSIYMEQCTYTHGRLTPTLQLSIDALNTTTPNFAHIMADLYIYIEQCTYTHGRLTPQSVEHRCLEYCYTKKVSHIAQCKYNKGRCTPPVDHRCMKYCYTKEFLQIPECIYTKGPLQLTIDLWNTTTLNMFNI